ncbi:MAG TPA: pseudouridine-5'-phosphate glycosidase [Acidimicrobiales bacterium]|nr:pseudouridine-5'-phosphate glycosidase [Acidimicrobiales bacterium]
MMTGLPKRTTSGAGAERSRPGLEMHFGTEVAAARRKAAPVLALESTIIAHGLPRPRNLEVARELEEIARSEDVTPATIAVLDGVVHIGLDDEDLERVTAGNDIRRLGRRDVAPALALSQSGATTVSATAWLAAQAGIRVFATGGLGGVHRGYGESMDEPADLAVLAVTPVTVVSAGVKSILDVEATLERLETLSVTVLGFKTDTFPGFYISNTGLPVDWTVSWPAEIAEVMGQQDALGIEGAILVANPVPEDQQLDPGLHDRAIAESLRAAQAQGVSGQAITPFLLDRLVEVTGGASLEANLAAIRNNVLLGARIAHAFAARH